MGYKLTEVAREDLRAITYYIALDNEKAAERVYKSVLSTCEQAAEMPGLGRHPDFIADSNIFYMNVKKFSQYLIFFKKYADGIRVLRIIHGARDLPDIFNK